MALETSSLTIGNRCALLYSVFKHLVKNKPPKTFRHPGVKSHELSKFLLDKNPAQTPVFFHPFPTDAIDDVYAEASQHFSQSIS
jgi:hypothetical protein